MAIFLHEHPPWDNKDETFAMKEPVVRFPVVCPQCGAESLARLPIAEVAAALINGKQLDLFTACHQRRWPASQVELQQIREYLGAPWINSQQSAEEFSVRPAG